MIIHIALEHISLFLYFTVWKVCPLSRNGHKARAIREGIMNCSTWAIVIHGPNVDGQCWLEVIISNSVLVTWLQQLHPSSHSGSSELHLQPNIRPLGPTHSLTHSARGPVSSLEYKARTCRIGLHSGDDAAVSFTISWWGRQPMNIQRPRRTLNILTCWSRTGPASSEALFPRLPGSAKRRWSLTRNTLANPLPF